MKQSHRELLIDALAEWEITLTERQLDLQFDYLRLVLQQQHTLNLSAIRPGEEAVLKHLADSLYPLRLHCVREAERIIDVGSGAGFPAVPLAIARPRCQVIALESRRKKARFIRQAIDRCRLENISVVCERSETFAAGPLRDSFPVVLCRALAAPPISLELCLPFVRPGGTLVVLSGAADARAAEKLGQVAHALGAASPEGMVYALPVLGHQRGIITVQKTSPTPPVFPRRAGMAVKRPLFAT